MNDLNENEHFLDDLILQVNSNEPENDFDDADGSLETSEPPKRRKYCISRPNGFYESVIPTMSFDDFRHHFRMSRTCFQSIMTRIANKVRIYGMSKKLLFVIWMLSTRESFGMVGERFGLSKGSSHQHFCDILDGLIVLFKEYVAWPNECELTHIEQGFRPKAGKHIPGIVGAISSYHFPIKKTTNHSIYQNSRQTHSIIVQAVCDHQKIFTDVYIGAPGCLNPERVFNNSPLSKMITNLIPADYHIAGNIHYPPKQNLVVPFKYNEVLTNTQQEFNDCVVKNNAMIEEAIILLVSRFRRLVNLETPYPQMANKIICASIILHNHIIMTDLDDDPSTFLEDPPAIYLNVDSEEEAGASDDDLAGIKKRYHLLSLFESTM